MNISSDSSLSDVVRHRRIPVAWLLLILFDVFLIAAAGSQHVESESSVPAAASQVTVLEGPDSIAPEALRFEAIDVFVDSGAVPLAAYQCELASRSPGMEIVGIEGGEHPAFKAPPYYDPRAMNNNRVILAAFHTGDALPAGMSRVARVHVQLQGAGEREYETLLTASATSGGERIPAEIRIARVVRER